MTLVRNLIEDSYNQGKGRGEFIRSVGSTFREIEVAKQLPLGGGRKTMPERPTAAAEYHEQERKPSPTAWRARFYQ